jgi:iron complex transport system permease protein
LKKGTIILLLAACLVVAFLEIALGRVQIPLGDVLSILFGSEGERPTWNSVIWASRVPRALTAFLAGSGLALSGLLMQTYFRNPLAGPSVLGITSGASLAVAFLVLFSGGMASFQATVGISGPLAIAVAAFAGSMFLLFMIMLVAKRLSDPVSLLIFGMMTGYVVSALVSVLQFGSGKEALRTFVLWGMGSFADLLGSQLTILTVGVLGGFALLIPVARHLNVILLGDDQAASIGVPVKRVRLLTLLSTGLLTGTITAFCGPIAFLGLAVPHLARGMFKTSNHKVLLWVTPILGGGLGLLCDLISRMPWTQGGLPLNAVTCMVGAPVVMWVIFRNRRLGRMF